MSPLHAWLTLMPSRLSSLKGNSATLSDRKFIVLLVNVGEEITTIAWKIFRAIDKINVSGFSCRRPANKLSTAYQLDCFPFTAYTLRHLMQNLLLMFCEKSSFPNNSLSAWTVTRTAQHWLKGNITCRRIFRFLSLSNYFYSHPCAKTASTWIDKNNEAGARDLSSECAGCCNCMHKSR